MRITAARFRALVAPPAAEPAPKPRRGDGGNCLRCGKALVYAAADGLGPVCRRIIAAEQNAEPEQ